MSKIIIYHNPRCKKSRAGLAYLEQKADVFEIRKYISELLVVSELGDVLDKLNKDVFDIVRTQEEMYKKHLKGKKLSRDEWLKILVENPRLIQRPIIVVDDLAVIADPPENLDEIL